MFQLDVFNPRGERAVWMQWPLAISQPSVAHPAAMARKPKGEFEVGDEVVLEGTTGRTIEREDGGHVAVHLSNGAIVTLHERWVELVDQSADHMTYGLEARLKGVIRRVAPADRGEQLLSIAITGTTFITSIFSGRIARD